MDDTPAARGSIQRTARRIPQERWGLQHPLRTGCGGVGSLQRPDLEQCPAGFPSIDFCTIPGPRQELADQSQRQAAGRQRLLQLRQHRAKARILLDEPGQHKHRPSLFADTGHTCKGRQRQMALRVCLPAGDLLFPPGHDIFGGQVLGDKALNLFPVMGQEGIAGARPRQLSTAQRLGPVDVLQQAQHGAVEVQQKVAAGRALDRVKRIGHGVSSSYEMKGHHAREVRQPAGVAVQPGQAHGQRDVFQ